MMKWETGRVIPNWPTPPHSPLPPKWQTGEQGGTHEVKTPPPRPPYEPWRPSPRPEPDIPTNTLSVGIISAISAVTVVLIYIAASRYFETKTIGTSFLPFSLNSQTQGESVLEYIQQMISYAMIEGGINNEEKILKMQLRIKGLSIRPPHGDRKKARERNKQGLKLIQSRQFTNAAQAFQDAYQADPADIEIVNNLGYARMESGDLDAAEQLLFQALIFAPDRASAWANLGQLYARKDNLTASVACFANTYRFSRKKDSTLQFLQRLASDGNDKEREAASQALQLKLVQSE